MDYLIYILMALIGFFIGCIVNFNLKKADGTIVVLHDIEQDESTLILEISNKEALNKKYLKLGVEERTTNELDK